MRLQTPLGVVKFELTAENETAADAEFSLRRQAIPNTIQWRVDELWVGVWNVRVTGDVGVLKFGCRWESGYLWTEGGTNSGEDLDAQTFYNDEWQVSIGTDDDEVLQHRARLADGMPAHAEISFAMYQEDGLIVPIGGLEAGDQCSIHFAVAWAKSSEDVGPWLAVDRSCWGDKLVFGS